MGVFSSENSYLGIDIGTTGIKIVELKKENGFPKLISYGFSENPKIEPIDWQKNIVFAAKTINQILDHAGITSRSAISALPTFSVFSSVLNLTNVNKKDISSAVEWEAKKVIPLPLEEMILDWKYVKEDEAKKGNVKVLLTGAPSTLVKKYVEIFKSAQINLLSLETETFSLIRSLLGSDKSTVMIVEIGASTTDVTVVDKSIPMLNRSIDTGGLAITKKISYTSGMSLEKAEQLKYDLGIKAIGSDDSELSQIVIESISPIVNEIKYALNLFQEKYKKKTEKVILSGGSAYLPNLVNYLAKILDTRVIIGDPWARVKYDKELKPLLNQIGPLMSVAIGLAMREME